ncbi:MAG: rhodanese-like domain-containing protein [Legionella longbeachae]|nr:rhodanese-like domain-containing protein [Legionella longbeachae]
MEHLGQFIINHWQLWLALIVVLLLTFINELASQKKKAKELSPQAAVDLMNNENAIIIDLRDKELFKQGHIIDSINVKNEDFEQQKMDKYKNKPIILVCARGLQASSLANKLRTQGYQPLVLKGGIAAWQNADLPLIKGK